MTDMGTAYEVKSISWPQSPGLIQEVFQWKPIPKGRKQKSQIDDTRTEISYSASTAAGEADLETNTYASKDLGTPSSRSVESKRSKKRIKYGSKKSLKDTSGSAHSDAASSSPELPEPSKGAPKNASFLVTLSCPFCSDPDCLLNKASQCPLLRHNEVESASCTLCNSNCQCEENKTRFLPVSGLVPRDENGTPVTLLKVNGGPVENSYDWANRRRWVVPSCVRWEHTISEWITAPAPENTKVEDSGHRRRSHKSKSKRKSKAPTLVTNAAPNEQASIEEPKMEDDYLEKMILDGHGFKIFSKGQEKVLINYERKNCKYLGCSCVLNVDTTDCGCTEGHADKTTIKHNKYCRNKPNKMSLARKTSQGIEPIQKDLAAMDATEKAKSCNSITANSRSADKLREPSKQKVEKTDLEQKDGEKVHLIGKDVRDMSRADFLEQSLRRILGDTYRNCEETKAIEPEDPLQMDAYPFSCFGQVQSRPEFFGGSTCTCYQTCCYGKGP